MGHSGGRIFAPVNTDDVMAATGTNSHDVATLCSSEKIRRWAKYKPVRFNKLDMLTEAERQSVSYGLAFTYIASAASAAVNLVANLQTALPTLSVWAYEHVRPGTDWSRLEDFLNTSDPEAPGYNHDAKPPLNGFKDMTLFESQFGSESVYYSCNFKWGDSSQHGIGDTSGIEIPVTKLRSDITNGTWRLGMLIFFPNNGKYQVAVASSKAAISDSLSQMGDMLVRPAGTGQLKELFANAFKAGVKEVDAIPILCNGISRGGTGNSDRWMFDASAQVIGMPMGEKIKIKLSSRFSNVAITFHSITIKYLDNAGTVKSTYTLTPTDASSGQHKTQLAAPSASGALRCQVTLDFTMSGSMASGDKVLKTQLGVGVGGFLIDTFPDTLERYLNSTWSAISEITSLGGRYRMTATDAGPATERSELMSFIESLPRRATNSVDLTMQATVSLAGAEFNSGNYFYHHG